MRDNNISFLLALFLPITKLSQVVFLNGPEDEQLINLKQLKYLICSDSVFKVNSEKLLNIASLKTIIIFSSSNKKEEILNITNTLAKKKEVYILDEDFNITKIKQKYQSLTI